MAAPPQVSSLQNLCMDKILESVHHSARFRRAPLCGHIADLVTGITPSPNVTRHRIAVFNRKLLDSASVLELPLPNLIKARLIDLHEKKNVRMICQDICSLYPFSGVFKSRFYAFIMNLTRLWRFDIDDGPFLVEFELDMDEANEISCSLEKIRASPSYYETVRRWSCLMLSNNMLVMRH